MPRGAGANAGRSTSTRQSKQNQEPSSTRSKSQASTTAAASSDATPYLVALAGVRALESHVQDSSRGRKWKDRVSSWEERAGLGVPATKLALGFLDVLGVSRASIYKRMLETVLSALIDRIPQMTEDQMLQLLNDSFRYATQPELKCVPLKIITSMSVVPDKVLAKIVELQTHEPMLFEELGLPLPIKRLAWERDFSLFVKVIIPHAEKYMASEITPRMIVASQQVTTYKSLDTIRRRKVMGPLCIDALTECTGGRPVLVGYLCDYVADRFAQEPSHSKGGMWAALLTDMLVTTRERAYGSISDQALDRLCALASRLDLAVREDAFSDVAVREVQRLFREATGISEDGQERAKVSRRASVADISKDEDEATKHRKTLLSAWQLVSKIDKQELFKEPVTEAIAPGYNNVISNPMDLSTIQKKVKSAGYRSFAEFDRDLRLMWKNCRVYNGEKSLFFLEATRQEEEWSKNATAFEETLRLSAQSKTPPPSTAKAPGGGGSGAAVKRKRESGVGTAGDDSQGGGAGGGGGTLSLTPMVSATQLEREGLGRRVGLAAMLLSEPFTTKLMYRHASAGAAEACRVQEMLPRDHPTLASLLQLLELGDAAKAMFQAGSFGVRAVEEKLTRTVLPCVVALHVHAYNASRVSASSEMGEMKDETRPEDDLQDVKEDWRKWYKEFPAVRRITCTMLCRASIRGYDEAAALLLPAAQAAVKRMADEQWLWATLLEASQKNAGVAKGDSPGRLKLKTFMSLLELFSRGLESARPSDAITVRALDLVHNLLPATPKPDKGSEASSQKPPRQISAEVLSLLEDIFNRAATAADNRRNSGVDESVNKRLTDLTERIFTKMPEWRSLATEAPEDGSTDVGSTGDARGGGNGNRGATARGGASVKASKRKQLERGGVRGSRSGGPDSGKKRVKR